MAKLDWDREMREARKRKHGAIPLWADSGAVSIEDDREIQHLLQPLVDIVDEFAEFSHTQRRQRGSEFGYRIRTRANHVRATSSFANSAARDVLAGRIDHLIERLKELESAG